MVIEAWFLNRAFRLYNLPAINAFLFLLLNLPLRVVSQIGFAETNVNITIAQLQSIEVSHSSVSINMNQASHFITGSSTGVLNDHVRIVSSTAYQVTVQADSQFFFYNGVLSTLPIGSVLLGISSPQGLSGPQPATVVIVSPEVDLPSQPLTIISAASQGLNTSYAMEYKIPAKNAVLYLNRPPGTYSSSITYTLLPQ
ncbi:hypothetical protein DEU42_106149 [Flavobacterium sp. AG291]|nr:hypothetical protein DEU42_106149 [Flavobacterium sp. AG291]